jgi:hypothetical protein
MSKREERQVFDMAKQDIPFLKDLELVKHDDRPDFVLKDKNGRIIGLEHFRADVYHGQYFDKSTPKPKIYPAFSFGLTNITSMDTYAEHREGKINILFNMQANQPKYDVSATKTMLKNERRKLDREERKHFDKVTKDFCK